jgi:hypothetical protein
VVKKFFKNFSVRDCGRVSRLKRGILGFNLKLT